MNEAKQTNEEELFTIDIRRILLALWDQKILIAVISVLCAVLVTIGAYFLVVPKYSADIMVYVNNSSISIGSTSLTINSGEISAARQLLDTYVVLLKSRTALDAVIQKANLPYTRGQLKSMVSAGSVNKTEVFTVVVTASNPEEARIIADTFAGVLPDIVSKTIKGSSVEIIDYAVLPSTKVSPGYSTYALIGFAIGFVIVCGIIVVLEMLNDKIHDEGTMAEIFDSIPVLATIPNRTAGKRYSRYSYYSKYGSGYRSGYGYGSGYGHGYGYGYGSGYGYGYGYGHRAKKQDDAVKEEKENGEK